MSSQFQIVGKDGDDIELFLDARSGRFDLDIHIKNPELYTSEGLLAHSLRRKMTEDEVLELAISILGPLHYYSEKPDEIMKKVTSKLRERGYT